MKKALSVLLAITMLLSLTTTAFAAVEDTGFSDVDANAWYADAVIYCRENNIMSGTASTTFSPQMDLSRAMITTILWRMDGSPAITANASFNDVPSGEWYSDAVVWASSEGIVSGYNAQTFAPNDLVTREQLAVLLRRYAEYKGMDTNTDLWLDYNDAMNISSWALSAVTWATDADIISAKSGNLFDPQTGATRAEVAVAIYHFSALSQPVVSPESSTAAEQKHNLTLSDMVIKITSQGNTATFRLYDTVAAKELYDQLPLSLDLSNFRNAQWMFYPPQKLNVTADEAYHDGKKGELSYYEPWGDAFMLYEDFYAGDEMHRLGVCLTGIDGIAGMSGTAVIEKNVAHDENAQANTQEGNKMKITVGGYSFTATLANNSSAEALRELLAGGPVTINMSDYGGFEKVGSLGTSLPRNDEQITTGIGDIILYQGNQLVVYYAPNSFSFTRLGKIDDTTGLKDALGSGNVTVTLSLGE